jgi:ribosomal protein L11 methyltransferase
MPLVGQEVGLSANILHELQLLVPQDLVEPASDALLNELQALSVSIEDFDAGSSLEQPLFAEPGMPAPQAGWTRSVLKVLFASSAIALDAATQLMAQDWAQDGEHGIRMQGLSEVAAQDWVRLTQSQFSPIEVTPSFWVVPSWHKAPAAAQKIIHLDPGLAFGTGSHPTTRMCLRWIAQHAQAWERALDYGCGSGILAIGAVLYGARQVDALDIDPAAVQATIANAQSNGVECIRAGLADTAHGQYPLVLANILATPLTLLAPLLCQHVAPGGHLILAGILERQASGLQAAYAPWLSLEVQTQEEDWILMTAQRAAH